MYVVRYVAHHPAVERRVLSFSALLHIVAEQTYGITAEKQHGHHVGDDHQRHGQVYNAEGFLKGHVAPQQHSDTREQAKHEDGLAALADEADVGLAIEVVGNDGTVGEKEDGS